MSVGEILKPKSKDEVKDLEKRGFRKNGGKWRFTIDIEDIIKEYDKNEDTEYFRTSIYELLKSRIDDIGLFADVNQSEKFTEITEKFGELDESPKAEDLDSVMEDLYNWADNNDVWINSF